MDREEIERQCIFAILQESDLDSELLDQDVCDEEDHLSERSNPSDTEQDISEADDDDISLSTLLHRSRSPEEQCTSESSSSSNANRECPSGFYYGKDGTM
ncbi:unnamed protein product [Parnassius apollo]|uniref:(apollo) hypothetical protein n=1 Tax=Parnassius apollo TaxID=110799 RepID=A0A8S3WNI6_PARAO|nr:unnamed protein product [Parnassius apollo]